MKFFPLKRSIVIVLILLCFSQCKVANEDYSNKPTYNLNVGDTLMIYQKLNSCCYYCSPNKHSLNHLKFIEERLIVPEPPDCMGCDQTVALVFVAESIGNDTLLEKIVGATLTCNDTSDNFNSHVVIVR